MPVKQLAPSRGLHRNSMGMLAPSQLANALKMNEWSSDELSLNTMSGPDSSHTSL